MSSTINISLSASLKKWVDAEMQAGGFERASEFMHDVLKEKRERALRKKIDAHLLKALKSPERPMTARMWTEIREAGKKTAAKRTKK